MPCPTGPAASNHTDSTASSREHDQADAERRRAPTARGSARVGVAGSPGRAASPGVAVRDAGFAPPALATGRRDGEVFVATYTSMITGRITGFRSVTSKKYLPSDPSDVLLQRGTVDDLGVRRSPRATA